MLSLQRWEAVRATCSTVARCVRSIVTKACSMEASALNKAVDRQGWRPLHYCALAGNSVVAQRLLNLGADPNIKSTDGWTPLHNAAYSGKADIAEVLLAHGAKATITDRQGEKPSDKAKRMRFLLLSERLLCVETLEEVVPPTETANAAVSKQMTAALLSELQNLDQLLSGSLTKDIDEITDHFELHVKALLDSKASVDSTHLTKRECVDLCILAFLEHEQRLGIAVEQLEDWADQNVACRSDDLLQQHNVFVEGALRQLLELEWMSSHNDLCHKDPLGALLTNFHVDVRWATMLHVLQRVERREHRCRLEVEETAARERTAIERTMGLYHFWIRSCENRIKIAANVLIFSYNLFQDTMLLTVEGEANRLEIGLDERQLRGLWFMTFCEEEECLLRDALESKETACRENFQRVFNNVHGKSHALSREIRQLQFLSETSIENVIRKGAFWRWHQRNARHRVILQYMHDNILVPCLTFLLRAYFFKWHLHATHTSQLTKRKAVCARWEQRCMLQLRRRYLLSWTLTIIELLKRVQGIRPGRRTVGASPRTGLPICVPYRGNMPAQEVTTPTTTQSALMNRAKGVQPKYHSAALPPILSPPAGSPRGPRVEIVHTLQLQAERLTVDVVCSHRHPLRSKRFL